MRRRVKLLFLCNQNRMRSPTAEHLLQRAAGYIVKSAGLAPDCPKPISAELLRWADLIFVMQAWHWLFLEENFRAAIKGKRVICLHIPDEYYYMEPELVFKLKAALAPHLQLPE